MIEFKFVGGAYEARSPNLNAQKCQNYYPVVDDKGAKNIIALMGSPGLTEWADSGHEAEVRQLFADESYLYAVIGNRVYRFSTTAEVLQMTGTISTSTGPAWMAKNDNSEIGIVGEPDGYILDTTTNVVTIIAAVGFPEAIGLIQQDGYFIVPVQNSHNFNYSGYQDGTSWSALNFYKADSQPDFLVDIASMGRELWVMGKKTTEIWYNSGDPFARYQNIFLEIGCAAAGSMCVTPTGLLWLDNFLRVMQVSLGNYQPVPVSTYQIDYQIKQMTTQSDARSYWYQGEGHTFYVLTFPTDGKTFEYNLSTGFWNTRASGATDARHRGNCSAFFNGKWIIGDFENGKLYELDYDAFTENGEVMRAIRRGQVIHQNGERLFHHRLFIDHETGVGLATGQGDDPQAMLRYSDDGGHTWSSERWTSLGKIGEYGARAEWRRLGAPRTGRIYEEVISDPVKRTIINAYISADDGKIRQEEA